VLIPSVNHAPTIYAAKTSFAAAVDADTVLPTLIFQDVDIAKLILNSNGSSLTGEATISVLLSVSYGSLSLPVTSGVSLSVGTGYLDKTEGLNGPLEAVNTAMQSLVYSCASTDLCAQLGSDSIRVLVNDNGFSGKGGALTATSTLSVIVT
jgi:hypothetical protein